MAFPQHSGTVYKHKGKNELKETWLCLDTNGKLSWKKKDAYEIKGVAYVDEILGQVQISGWTAKKCAQNANMTPFLIHLPMIVHGSKCNETLIVKSGADLDSWLDAFATAVGKWRLWKISKQRQALRIARQSSLDERHVEQQLTYDELVEFYKVAWSDFLARYRKDEVENGIQIAQQQNGTTIQNGAYDEIISSNSHETPNGLQKSEQSSNNAVCDYGEIDHATANTHTAITVTTVTIHQHPVNGAIVVQNAETEVHEADIGDEDEGEELHF